MDSEEATVVKKGRRPQRACPGGTLSLMNLASVSLSVKHRAVWVAVRIRKGHIREAMTSSCMSSSYCFHWRTWLSFRERHMEESPRH